MTTRLYIRWDEPQSGLRLLYATIPADSTPEAQATALAEVRAGIERTYGPEAAASARYDA